MNRDQKRFTISVTPELAAAAHQTAKNIPLTDRELMD